MTSPDSFRNGALNWAFKAQLRKGLLHCKGTLKGKTLREGSIVSAMEGLHQLCSCKDKWRAWTQRAIFEVQPLVVRELWTPQGKLLTGLDWQAGNSGFNSPPPLSHSYSLLLSYWCSPFSRNDRRSQVEVFWQCRIQRAGHRKEKKGTWKGKERLRGHCFKGVHLLSSCQSLPKFPIYCLWSEEVLAHENKGSLQLKAG